MQVMTIEEARAFLLEKPWIGKLATVREDGRPHIAPIWFDVDQEEILFTTWYTTVKAANLQRDGRVAFCVDDEKPPYAFVIVEGTATVEKKAKDLLYWTTRIAERYFGKELADSYGKRNAVEGEYLVRIKPTRIVAQKGIAD